MLYYDRIDISKGIDINMRSESKSLIFVTIVFFLDKWFKFQMDLCSGCHDVLMMSINLSDIATLNVNDADYHCIISGISKIEAINLLQNIDLTQKKGNNIKHAKFIITYKNS